jgi:hypothetical protein
MQDISIIRAPPGFGWSAASARASSQAVAACREQTDARPPQESSALAQPRSSYGASLDLN